MARIALNQFCKKWKSIWNRIQRSLAANCDKVINRILERRLIFDGTVTNAVTIQLHQGQSCGDGRTSQGRLIFIFIDYVREEVGLEPKELKTAVRDRDVWRGLKPTEFDPSGRHD